MPRQQSRRRRNTQNLIPMMPLGNDPEITESFKFLVGEVECPPGTDKKSFSDRCQSVLLEAMDRALVSAGYQDAAPNRRLKDA
jgi:hypothetical protein